MPIDNITQTMSTISPPPHRGVDVQTVFVNKQEDFQDHLAGITIDELNTLKDQLNSRIGEINSTATTMNGYATSASSSATTATTKAGEASTSASEALTSRNQASTSATNSSNSATKASQWADNNYNVAVEAGKYSAKHWSTVAQNTVNNKVEKVTSTDNAIVRFDGTTGAVQNSGVIIDDNGNLTIITGSLKGSHGAGNIATNTVIGVNALTSNTTGSYNTANGVNALTSNTTGNQNTANGVQALENNTTGTFNTANGTNALRSNTTGNQNTANGDSALGNNTTYSNASGFGYNSQVTGSNQVQLGNESTTTYVYGTVQNRSDIRDKADIRDTILGLDFIQSLRPVDYKWDMREDYKPARPELEVPKKPILEILEPTAGSENYDAELIKYNDKRAIYDAEMISYEVKKTEYDLLMAEWLEGCKHENITRDGSKKRTRYHQGFIAQEVLTLDVDFGGIQDLSIKGGEDVLSIGYDEIIAPLVKAVQEQQAMIEVLKARIETLEGAK